MGPLPKKKYAKARQGERPPELELVVQGSLEVMVAEDRLPLARGAASPEGFFGLQDWRRIFPLRLDDDGAYTVQAALEVARALEGELEMLEQPTPADDWEALWEVSKHSPVPILADQSVVGPASALELAARHVTHGLSVKVARCGGLRCASQVDAIARAARMATMVGCIIEPALLIAAGLSLALSSPNVRYGDLDGHLDLLNDPSVAGFTLEDGWLVASDEPGLGCTVKLG
jgi:L-alanine-DL-glutamate epimerase-like enolase superfamily enzyme